MAAAGRGASAIRALPAALCQPRIPKDRKERRASAVPTSMGFQRQRLPVNRGDNLFNVRIGHCALRANEHTAAAAHSMRASAQVTARGAATNMIVAVSTRPNRQNRSTCSSYPRKLVTA